MTPMEMVTCRCGKRVSAEKVVIGPKGNYHCNPCPTDERVAFILKAYQTIRNRKNDHGNIQCPKCGYRMNYSVASNGHIRAKCETQDCLTFMQ